MFIVINPDDSINAIVHDEAAITATADMRVVRCHGSNAASILDQFPIEEAYWDADSECVRHDPFFKVGSEAWRNRKASEHINHYYPLYKQMNMLRKGDKAAIKTMGLFIDKCRKWAMDDRIATDVIERIVP